VKQRLLPSGPGLEGSSFHQRQLLGCRLLLLALNQQLQYNITNKGRDQGGRPAGEAVQAILSRVLAKHCFLSSHGTLWSFHAYM
jgi:hypothetical protein